MTEQRISGNLVFQPETGARDGGCYTIENPRTNQSVGIPTYHLTPADLRAMADHLEARRQGVMLR
jgi:hypothetical protein